jgi:hypothetical protein
MICSSILYKISSKLTDRIAFRIAFISGKAIAYGGLK